MSKILLLVLILSINVAEAQIFSKKEEEKKGFIRLPKYVATKRTYGMIAGVERGQYTFMELGVEKHWKKIRLVHARTVGANANMEYNFGNNILGYNAGAWIKTGRVDLTYGATLNYITDFEKSRYGFGPQIGFRLLGLHFVNGYNFLLGNKELNQVNKFYVGLRYYFPLQSKTTVVNVNKRSPEEKEKARNPGKATQDSKKKKPLPNVKGNNKKKKNEPEVVEKKGIFNIFKKKEPESLPDKKKNRKNSQSKNQENKNKKEKEKETTKSKFWDYFRNNE
ncbi:MAG: hypothetical protein M3512_05210 [Bacteroidota bacterium]|nr:hypothetical protein [Bacteroidota bacterium]